MADAPKDDVVVVLSIRTEDDQEAKSVLLTNDVFKSNETTGEVDFASDEARDDVLERVRKAILLVAAHPQLESGGSS
jgi:hypothetical protein